MGCKTCEWQFLSKSIDYCRSCDTKKFNLVCFYAPQRSLRQPVRTSTTVELSTDVLCVTMMMACSDPVRLRDDLRGRVSSGPALRPCQQRHWTAPRRLQADQVLPAFFGAQGSRHRCLVQHSASLRSHSSRQQRTSTPPPHWRLFVLVSFLYLFLATCTTLSCA